jgi:hypothetical protein
LAGAGFVKMAEFRPEPDSGTALVISGLFQAHYNNHRHDRNYSNEKVVLANRRTRTENELRDGGFGVVVEMFIRDPDYSTPMPAAKLRDSGTDSLSNL